MIFCSDLPAPFGPSTPIFAWEERERDVLDDVAVRRNELADRMVYELLPWG